MPPSSPERGAPASVGPELHNQPPLPFAGIRSGRPWSATGLTTARWIGEVPVFEVALADLWLTQEHLDTAALFGRLDEAASWDPLPHVVTWRGTRYLEDGHHRVVRAALVGATAMWMRVFAVD